MGQFAVFLIFASSFLASTSAFKKTNFRKQMDFPARFSDFRRNHPHPVDEHSQMQLRQEVTDARNPDTCHCMCQASWSYDSGPVCPNYYRNCSRLPIKRPRDCQEMYQRGYNTTGVYVIYPDGLPQGIYVRCDMETAGGGWTFIQRRVNGDVDFYRDWSDYKQGFGDLDGNFWIGNDNIHLLTAQDHYQLRIDLSISSTNTTYVMYSSFNVGDENSGYILTGGGYSGIAVDALSYHFRLQFSNKDRDNDVGDANCAQDNKGGWWYNHCYMSNLNGVYGSSKNEGLNWFSIYLVYADMKVRKMLI
ncbi:hypothetical protein ACJMK2_025318 [Sinanodonta woodiana]|uniref:Fibrinogen C-terminal domain-containing protein n=1 Tax=Sinanodonta woodiana TaxID=1069815 RepID=A0ABD3XGM7_SINWO